MSTTELLVWVVLGTEQWVTERKYKSLLSAVRISEKNTDLNWQANFQLLDRVSRLDTCRMSEVHTNNYKSKDRDTYIKCLGISLETEK